MSEGGHNLSPVEKLQYLLKAAGRSELSRGELAVLNVIACMTNSRTGQAWPSYTRLAELAGMRREHAFKVTNNLIDRGLITLVQKGNQTRSNRYALNRQFLEGGCLEDNTLLEGSGLETTTLGSGLENNTVVVPRQQGSGLGTTEVVVYRQPESINQSDSNRRIDNRQDGADSPGRPGGLQTASVDRGRDCYPEFWQAIGCRTTVCESEQLIREYIAKGIDEQEIIEGAKRYAEYNRKTGGNNRTSVKDWLIKQRWRDDWTVTEYPAKGKANKKKGLSEEKKARLLYQANAAYQAFEKHAEECGGSCMDLLNGDAEDTDCAEGQKLWNLSEKSNDTYEAALTPEELARYRGEVE